MAERGYFTVLLIILFVSCATKDLTDVNNNITVPPVLSSDAGDKLVSQTYSVDEISVDTGFSDLPPWVWEVPQEIGRHYEVGSGNLPSFSASRRFALQDARNNMAQWLSTTITNAVETGSSTDSEGKTTEFFRTVSLSYSSAVLTGVSEVDLYESLDGTVWVLMCMDTRVAFNTIRDAVYNNKDVSEMNETILNKMVSELSEMMSSETTDCNVL